MNREESARIITACKIDGFRRITSVIFDINGVSPALTTPSGGGGVIPKIIEMNEEPKIVSYSRDKKGKIDNYHLNEVANTIHGGTGSNCNTAQYVLEPKPIVEMNKYPSNHGETVSIADPFVVASRGREPNVLIQPRTEEAKLLRKDYENHRINIQRKYMQQMEPRTDGVSNTITSVQKDNMLLEPLRIKANTREGFAEVEEYGAVNISHPSSRTRRGRVQGNKGDIIGTLLTGEENAVLEPKAEEVRRVAEEVRRQPCGVTVDKDNNLRPYRQDKAKSGVAELQTEFAESVGSTLTSARPNNVYGDTFPYRIRRLTPRECFRLQDVSEEDIDKIQNYKYPYMKRGKRKHISESQQYKLAGNSIPVACMFYIFKNLFSSPVEKAADAAPV